MWSTVTCPARRALTRRACECGPPFACLLLGLLTLQPNLGVQTIELGLGSLARIDHPGSHFSTADFACLLHASQMGSAGLEALGSALAKVQFGVEEPDGGSVEKAIERAALRLHELLPQFKLLVTHVPPFLQEILQPLRTVFTASCALLYRLFFLFLNRRPSAS